MNTMEPFVSQRQWRRRRLAARLKAYGVIVLLITLVSGAVWGMNRLPLIKLTSVNVVGGRPPLRAALAPKVIASVTGSVRGRLWGSDNLLSWPDGPLAIANVLAASVSIDRHWRTRSVTVTVVERMPYGLWCTVSAEAAEDKRPCAVFDREGVILRTETESNPEEPLPIVYDGDPSPGKHSNILGNVGMSAGPGDRVLPPDFFVRLLPLIEEFKNEPSLRTIEWKGRGRDITVIFDSGPLLLFSVRFNPDFSLRALKKLKEMKTFSSLTEIDFRSENRVFYH